MQGARFIEIDSFDSACVRVALYFPYGWDVDANGAIPVTDQVAKACGAIGVPIGHLSKPHRGNCYNDNREFLSGASNDRQQTFLHPHFMKGEEARAFITLLTGLTEAERWEDISCYLHERSPVILQDLRDAAGLFSPKLLFPSELWPLAKLIPIDANHSEITYLAKKISDMDEDNRRIFMAVVEVECHCESVSEIINITENLECFELLPDLSVESYGRRMLEDARKSSADTIERLRISSDPDERDLARHTLKFADKHEPKGVQSDVPL
jgi:hypothetical protein